MNNFKRISKNKANELLLEELYIIDIRDQDSFNAGHIDNAINLNNKNMEDFITSADKKKITVVYCYHGNFSQNAAYYLSSKGFETAYSVDGGFEEWKND